MDQERLYESLACKYINWIIALRSGHVDLAKKRAAEIEMIYEENPKLARPEFGGEIYEGLIRIEERAKERGDRTLTEAAESTRNYFKGKAVRDFLEIL